MVTYIIAVDTPFHPLYSSVSARVAAGGLIELVNRIVEGDLHNGFALIRPPGMHFNHESFHNTYFIQTCF